MTAYDINDKIKYLFDRPWDEDLSDSQESELLAEAEQLVDKAGWPETYSAAISYLHEACVTPESAINFAHLFWDYGWYEKANPGSSSLSCLFLLPH